MTGYYVETNGDRASRFGPFTTERAAERIMRVLVTVRSNIHAARIVYEPSDASAIKAKEARLWDEFHRAYRGIAESKEIAR